LSRNLHEHLRMHAQLLIAAAAAMWWAEHSQAMRQAALESLRRNHDFLADWEEKGRLEHRQNQARKQEVERAELRYELAVKEKKERKKWAGNAKASHEVVAGIDEFEKTLARLGGDVSSADGEAAKQSSIADDSPAAHLQTLKMMLPHPKAVEEEARSYLGTVKEKKAEEVYGECSCSVSFALGVWWEKRWTEWRGTGQTPLS
jgi:hypothetical protein